MHQSNLQAQVQVLATAHAIHHVTALCPAALVWRPGSQPERFTATQHRPDSKRSQFPGPQPLYILILMSCSNVVCMPSYASPDTDETVRRLLKTGRTDVPSRRLSFQALTEHEHLPTVPRKRGHWVWIGSGMTEGLQRV
jgi:hypothetical protein